MLEGLHKRLKLSHHRHTGRRLSHSETSHGALVVILVAVGLMLAVASRGIMVSAQTVTEQGSIDIGGTVPGPPPSSPAVIEQPHDGQIFDYQTIDVSGTCPLSTVVEIYKNNILAGSSLCQNGNFSLKIDLIIGSNILIAKVKDNLNQYGPDSTPVTVTYRLKTAAPVGPAGVTVPQLLIVPKSQYFGVREHQSYRLQLTILGGSPPYAVSVNWGDGQTDLISRPTAGQFDANHTYNSKRVYYLKINASDPYGNKAFTQSVVIVSLSPLEPVKVQKISTKNFLFLAWPLYVSSFAAVSTFWLGEKYEKHKIEDEELWKTSSKKSK